jgi:DNA invertase Pin-like site-specific DNA recombinase
MTMTIAPPQRERAARLFRVSTNGQTEDNQIPEVDIHCRRHDYDVVETFQLHDVSASKGAQAGTLDQILDDIRAGRYTVVVVAASSRIDRRDPNIAMFWLLSVRLAGGRVESVREPEFGQDNLAGRIMTMLAQEGNYKYVVDLTEHTEAGMQKIRENGALAGAVPWGYVIEGPKHNKRMVPGAVGGKYIPQIYAKVIAGWSLAAIGEWLESEGVPSPRLLKPSDKRPAESSGKWWPRTVQRIVRNPAYKGLKCPQGETPGSTWKATPTHRAEEPLIDGATWQRAQDALVSRPRRGPAMPNRAMLTPALWCGNPDCPAGPDSPMYRLTPRSNYVYYRCAGKGARRSGCGNMVPLAAVDAAADLMLSTLFTEQVTVNTRVPGNGAVIEAALEDNRLQMRELNVRDDLDEDAYDEAAAALRAERKRIADTLRTEDTYTYAPAGYTYADRWAGLATAERGGWLAEHGFRVTATRTEVTVTKVNPVTGEEEAGFTQPLPEPRPVRRDSGRPRGPQKGVTGS